MSWRSRGTEEAESHAGEGGVSKEGVCVWWWGCGVSNTSGGEEKRVCLKGEESNSTPWIIRTSTASETLQACVCECHSSSAAGIQSSCH